MTNIRAVAFDAVKTVMYPSPPVPQIYAQIGRQFGSAYTETEVAGRFWPTVQAAYATDGSDLQLATSEDNERQRWQKIVGQVLDDVENIKGCFAALFASFGDGKNWACYSDVDSTIRAVLDSGLQVAIASNFDRRLHSVCEFHPPLARIPIRVVSTEVGFSKPARQFYEAIGSACELNLSQILMVGDGRTNDYEGAIQNGMPALWLDRSGQHSGPEVIHSLSEVTGRIEIMNRTGA